LPESHELERGECEFGGRGLWACDERAGSAEDTDEFEVGILSIHI
jgi:hypothetical protein